MALNKKRILPDEYVFKQGDKGSTAFLIISGAKQPKKTEIIGLLRHISQYWFHMVITPKNGVFFNLKQNPTPESFV